MTKAYSFTQLFIGAVRTQVRTLKALFYTKKALIKSRIVLVARRAITGIQAARKAITEYVTHLTIILH
jgi:hypothetical protein